MASDHSPSSILLIPRFSLFQWGAALQLNKTLFVYILCLVLFVLLWMVRFFKACPSHYILYTSSCCFCCCFFALNVGIWNFSLFVIVPNTKRSSSFLLVLNVSHCCDVHWNVGEAVTSLRSEHRPNAGFQTEKAWKELNLSWCKSLLCRK